MEHTSHEFLRQLLETPSPSGFEQAIQQVVRNYAKSFADEVRTDSHGNVFAARFPEGRPADAPRIMLAGHCDQIGLMVQYIDGDGFLYIQPIGGWDMQILLGQSLTVWAKDGPITGVVAPQAIHLLKPDERNKVPDFIDVWVDIGAKNKEEAESLVRCGDPVTFALGYRPLRNSLAASPAMDDKVGLWVVHGSGAAPTRPAAFGGGVRRLDRRGGNRPARRDDGRVCDQPDRRHRGRRVPRDRHAG